MAVSERDKLDKLLMQVRRIEEHREVDAEKAIRREYKKLYKELKEFFAVQYPQLLADGDLTMDILGQKQLQARFLEEVTAKMDEIMPAVHDEITELVDKSYEACYSGMIEAVKKAGTTEELEQLLSGIELRPEIVRAGVNNTLVNKIVLNDVLEKNRKEVVYNIKRDITIGLSNGDRLDTMTKRIAKTLDGDYKKAMRVARTESHRTVEAGFFDAAKEVDDIFKANDSKYRMVKIWLTMKDERVRPQRRKGKRGTGKIKTVMGKGANHVQMNGKTVLEDELFELSTGATTLAPGQSGEASEDINCRCILKQRLWTDEEFFKATGRHFPNYKAAAPPEPKSEKEEFKPLIEVKGNALDIQAQMDWENVRSKNITPAQKRAIYNHSGGGYIQTSNSWRINDKLRKNPDADFTDIFKGEDLKTVEALHDVIQSNTISQNTVVVRKAGNNFARETLRMNSNALQSVIEDFNEDYIQESLADYIGDKITEKSFVSTSANMELNVFTYKPVTLELQVPKGTKGFITENYAESEVIFDKGLEYEIVGFGLDDSDPRIGNSLKIIAKVVGYK